MKDDFYFRYYALIEQSLVHAEFCLENFGIDLCQHGFADLEQLKLIISYASIRRSDVVLDVGCGNGKITEYLCDTTGAAFVGLDYVPEAIQSARQRTKDKGSIINFQVGNMNSLSLPRSTFSVIMCIDSIYFSLDYRKTISEFKQALTAKGRMVFLYSYGLEPWVRIEDFPVGQLEKDSTPLAIALVDNGMGLSVVDLTSRDCQLAAKRKTFLDGRKRDFDKDGIGFVYENRMGEASGVTEACRLGMQRRYLYLASASKVRR
jgi:SAM-dependent methyltransferase